MAESQSVGGIHYDVAMDVKPLLSGERQVNTSLDRMEGSFNKASKSIESAEKSMFSFSKAAVAVTSALSVGAIVHAVDEWGQMAARIKMALKSAEGDIVNPIVGFEAVPLPVLEQKYYSAGEVVEMLEVSANKIGRIANKNGLKTDEFGKFFLDKSAHSSKQVEAFRYNENGISALRHIIHGKEVA